MFVLDEIVRSCEPRAGELEVMIALGPGMAAKLGCSGGRPISQGTKQDF
jgi:predicted naringenin-chalcone synthase